MTKGRVGLLIVASIVFLTVGFVIGQMVQAAGTIPGSAGDPLVAESYVEKTVGESVAALQTKIDELQAKVGVLEQEIETLSKEKGKNDQNLNSQASLSNQTPVQNSNAGAKKVTVTGKLANIRSGPGSNHGIIATMHTGETGTYGGVVQNGWCKIVLANGREGWVANWLVQVK
jgi:TolA-binding protein